MEACILSYEEGKQNNKTIRIETIRKLNIVKKQWKRISHQMLWYQDGEQEKEKEITCSSPSQEQLWKKSSHVVDSN